MECLDIFGWTLTEKLSVANFCLNRTFFRCAKTRPVKSDVTIQVA